MHVSLIQQMASIAILTAILGCQSDFTKESIESRTSQKPLTSIESTFLDFDWDGEVEASSYMANQRIDEQIKWTIGQLNGENAVGRIDHVEISDVNISGNVVSYHAKMVVAWGGYSIPSTYTLRLPKQTDYYGLSDFLEKYSSTCMGNSHGHEITLGDGWYYYRPMLSTCNLDSSDTASFVAQLTPNGDVTTGRYPEYHKVWEDNTLRVVAIFGKNEEDGDADDVGYLGFNRFVYQVRTMLSPYSPVMVPADIQTESGSRPTVPAPDVLDVEIRGSLPGGRTVVVTALSVPSIGTASTSFYNRYEALSSTADFISYNGHSGLGANIRTLAQKGNWVEGQYVIVLMNGCTTFAYVDEALANAHATVNADDPSGTKYLDMFTNAMPAYFVYNVQGTMAIVNALMAIDAPRNYEQILAGFHYSQLALVSGENDNSYSPSYLSDAWSVFEDSQSLSPKAWHHYGPFSVSEGGFLKAYTHGTNDVDLYVGRGAQPTSEMSDCRSTSATSSEHCVLSGAGDYYVSVFAWTENENTEYELNVTYSDADAGDDTDTEEDTDTDEDTDTEENTDTNLDSDSVPQAETLNDSGTILKGEWKHFPEENSFYAADGVFQVVMSGTDDADIYVWKDIAYGEHDSSNYACRPYKASSNETCDLQGPGQFIVGVNGYADSSSYELTISYTLER